MLVQTPGNAGAIPEPNTANFSQRWSTLTVQVSGGVAASGAVHRAYCLDLGEVVEALAGKADIARRYLSRPSQSVTVIAVMRQSVMPRLAGCGDRRPGLS
jgi:hypothetical protein